MHDNDCCGRDNRRYDDDARGDDDDAQSGHHDHSGADGEHERAADRRGPRRVEGAEGAVASSSGVLGTAKTLGSGTLPFTGLRLWIVELVAFGLIGGGVALRLIARRRTS